MAIATIVLGLFSARHPAGRESRRMQNPVRNGPWARGGPHNSKSSPGFKMIWPLVVNATPFGTSFPLDTTTDHKS